MTKNIVKHKRNLCGCIRRLSVQMLAACSILAGTAVMQSCEKDILEGQPEWLGNSIYERLQEGITTNDGSKKSFNYTLRLIDDLGEAEVLSHTGSKTIFASGDDDFEKWFQEKGITYEQLTLTEKKALLYNAMIDNAYLTELMTNVTGTPPLAGAAMRRQSSAQYLDSITFMKSEEMPSRLTSQYDEDNNTKPDVDPRIDAWSYDRTKTGIHIARDNSNPPMIHFLPKFMQNIGMTNEDLKIISNGKSNSIEDSWVNGQKVISTEQTCKNGYIYVVEGVMDYKSNMAQVLHERPDTKMWSQALDRFSVPVPVTGSALQNYRNSTGNTDTLYVMRYLNYYDSDNKALYTGGRMKTSVNPGSGALLFDPGWNQYRISSKTDNNTMYKDAAVMIVPTDDVIKEWLDGKGGQDFAAEFGSWENIPYENLAKIFNVNMLTSFTASLPSKFDFVLDKTTQNKLGIKPEDVKECIMCNNGVIYLVNKMFTPEDYSSIIYPTELKKTSIYSVINHALSGSYGGSVGYRSSFDFSPYLAALGTKFSFFTPYNVTESNNTTQKGYGKMFRMIDPCSYGIGANKDSLNIMEVYYGTSTENPTTPGVNATYYGGKYDGAGDITENSDVPTYLMKLMGGSKIANRLYNLIDNSVVIGEVDNAAPGQEYFLTKGGSILRVKKEGSSVKIQGGYQMEQDYWITIPDANIVHKSNGATYGLCSEEALQQSTHLINVPQSAQNSVATIIEKEAAKENSKCKLFYEYLQASGLLTEQSSGYMSGQGQKNLKNFDSFNYTVYVPTDDKIQEMINSHWLPEVSEVAALQALIDDPEYSESGRAQAKKELEAMQKIIKDFIGYHIQDNAVMVNGPVVNAMYETSVVNTATSRYYTLGVNASNGSITLTDNSGDTHHVTGFSNKVACEYWISGTPGDINAEIATTSSAVVHQIDGVLYYDKAKQQRDWKQNVPQTAKRSRFAR